MKFLIPDIPIQNKLSEYLQISSPDLNNYYNAISLSFAKDDFAKPHEGAIPINKTSISFQHKETRKNWEAATLIGVDLPIQLVSKVIKSKLMIVGIDPLRKRKDFPNVDKEMIILGIPYALHSSYYRNNKSRTKIYFDFIKHILEEYTGSFFGSGCHIYGRL